MVPPQQPFQFDLPAPSNPLPDYIPVRSAIQRIIDSDSLTADALINLAWRCARTHRVTDFRGGCNGARIRFPPESDFPANAGTADALALLRPVKAQFPNVPYTDLIVLAGITAIETESPDVHIPFCGGYVDAEDGLGSVGLEPLSFGVPLVTFEDVTLRQGLTREEGVALNARENLSSDFFMNLIEVGPGPPAEQALFMAVDLTEVVERFASDEDALKSTFVAAWTKLMTLDRFGDFRENACTGVDTPTLARDSDNGGNDNDNNNTGDEGRNGPDDRVCPHGFFYLLCVAGQILARALAFFRSIFGRRF